MDISDVEMLSASLVREYLARKRLAQTLSQLDEEQAGLSSCVRNRLQLVRALRIGRLMKRNKQLGTQLDTMLEVIVCFLVRHARKGKVERVQGENIEGYGTEVRGKGKEEDERGRVERRETIVREKVIVRKEGEGHGVREMERERVGREVENIERAIQSKYEIAEENRGELKEIGDGKITDLGKQHVSKDNFSKEDKLCEDKDKKHEKNKCNQEERQDILVTSERGNVESVVDVCKIYKEYAWNEMHRIYLDTGQNIENNMIKEKSDSKTPLDPRTAYDECENSSTFVMQTENMSKISETFYMQRNITGDMKGLESTSHSPQPLTLDSTSIVADSEKSLKDYSNSESDESPTDSDCSVSSVVDLLKDTHDSSCGKLRVTSDMFRRGNETSFFIDTCQTKTGVFEKTIKGKSTLKVAWEKDDDDREVEELEKHKVESPRRDSDEDMKIKWAMKPNREDTESDQSEEENVNEIEASSEGEYETHR